MPRLARTGKIQKNSNSEDDTTDAEATPKAKRAAGGNSRLKRRVSQHHPSNEDEEDIRIPLKPFNDEAAEKRDLKRRKSGRMTMALDTLGSQEEHNTSGGASAGIENARTPKKTALARANQLKSVAVTAPLAPVPLEIMTSNFEEWMKMATDNVSVQHIR